VTVYYRYPDGRPTREQEDYRRSLKPVRELYQDLPAAEFDSLALEAVQRQMVEGGLSRGVINQRVGRVRRMFKWGAAKKLVPHAVYAALADVEDLHMYRSAARETGPVQPVAESHVEAVLPHALPPVAAMIRLQRLTGMRPGEVVLMRACDIDTTSSAWTYKPSWHKMAYRGQDRVIFLGPKAQAVVKPFLTLSTGAYLFSPARAMTELRAKQRATRKTPVPPSQRHRARARPKKCPGERYTARSYGQAVAVACAKADRLARQERENVQAAAEGRAPVRVPVRVPAAERLVPRWGVNRLRHNFGTEVRRDHGLEASQVLLGHARADVTQVYAERDMALGERIAAQAG
jgi:integrase